jgi:DNA-binding MarR family transcriptional regulator
MPSPSTPCACSRLRRAARAVTQLYDDALAPADLRATQYALLRTLASKRVMRISALATALLLDRTALSRNLEPLAARGLVVVMPGADARTREARITIRGQRVLAQAQPCWEDAQAEVRRRVGGDRLDALYGVLADLERLHPGAPVQRRTQESR